MAFRKIMVTLLIILLVLFTIFIVHSVKNSKYGIKFPPRVAQCPDYFEPKKTDDGKIISCYNNLKLGNATKSGCMSWNPTKNQTITEMCDYRSNCNVGWDGLNDRLCNKKHNKN